MYKVSVIVPVYNELEKLKECLHALENNFNFNLGEIFLINDCSDNETTKYLEDFCNKNSQYKYIYNETNLGFVKTCNMGMALAKNEVVILLDSDTQIPAEFCEKIIKCFESDEKIGVASPISSNTCSYYYIPMPKNYNIEKMNRLLRNKHNCNYPVISAADSFCFCIRKNLIERQGVLDITLNDKDSITDFAYRTEVSGYKNVLINDLYVIIYNDLKTLKYSEEKYSLFTGR